MNDKGFAVVGSAVIITLAVFMGFGAAVIVQRGHLLHQARLTQQRISRSAHEGLTVSVHRESNSTDITITNDGSSTVVFNQLLLKQPDHGVVMMPSDDGFFDDLAGWWRFSEGNGDTAHDYSGNGNDGVLYGDPTWVDGWVGDGALEFDCVDDWVGVPEFPDFQTNFTIFARIKTSNNAESGQRIFADDESNTGGYALSLGDPGRGALRFYSRDMDTVSLDTATGVIKEDKQYPVAAVADVSNNNRFIYVKEKIKAELLSDTGVWGTDSGEASIGGETNQGEINNRFVGTIDEVIFFNRALKPGEISELGKYNVLLYPVSLTPLESYTVTYPFQVDDQATVGVYTQLGNIFWEEVS